VCLCIHVPSSEQEAMYSPGSSIDNSFTVAEWQGNRLISFPLKSRTNTTPQCVPSAYTRCQESVRQSTYRLQLCSTCIQHKNVFTLAIPRTFRGQPKLRQRPSLISRLLLHLIFGTLALALHHHCHFQIQLPA
jgi:hypothetical protein